MDHEVEGSIAMGTSLPIAIDVRNDETVKNINVTILIKTTSGETLCAINSLDRDWTFDAQPGRHTILVRLDHVPFVPGEYAVDVGLSPNPNGLAFDVILNMPLFSVVNRGASGSLAQSALGRRTPSAY